MTFYSEFPNDNPDLWTAEFEGPLPDELGDDKEILVEDFGEDAFANVEEEGGAARDLELSFADFARVLTDVLVRAGASRDQVALIAPALGLREPEGASECMTLVRAGFYQATGSTFVTTDAHRLALATWHTVLSGGEADFSAVAETFDDWSAKLLVRLADAPNRAAEFRQELRARGVCAFGMVRLAA